MQLGAIHRSTPAAVAHLAQRASLAQMLVPASVDWFKACPADGDALGNNDHGDCVTVTDYRIIQIRRANVSGDLWKPTAQLALGRYSKLTGFDLATGQPDIGTDVITDMTDWVTNGIWVNRQDLDVPLWVQVDPANLAHVKIGIAHTGPAAISLALPQAAQDLSNWAKAPGTGSDWTPAGWGYHREPVGKFDGDAFTGRTWGQDVEMHPEFWQRYVVAVDLTISRGWLDTTGTAPSGLDWDALRSDMALLAA